MPRRLHHLAPLLGVAPLAVVLTVGTATARGSSVPEPDSFTSAFRVDLTPAAVVDMKGVSKPGEAGAAATYDLRVNSDQDVVCYDIRLSGATEPFKSPARTATHLHEAAPGAAGPARIVFPNPQSGSSKGCLEVPVTVGLPPGGPDAGAAFSLEELEADPTAYYADIHTAMNPAGVVRGQVGAAVPVGGVATGSGGTAGPSTATTVAIVLVAGAALAGTATAVRRRASA